MRRRWVSRQTTPTPTARSRCRCTVAPRNLSTRSDVNVSQERPQRDIQTAGGTESRVVDDISSVASARAAPNSAQPCSVAHHKAISPSSRNTVLPLQKVVAGSQLFRKLCESYNFFPKPSGLGHNNLSQSCGLRPQLCCTVLTTFVNRVANGPYSPSDSHSGSRFCPF